MPVGSFKCFVEQKLGKFPNFLIYAILEWMMIILLFLDGFLAFISNEFAKYFELRIPCLLCTRIDHLLAHRSSSFYYNDSICEVHKKEISSLAYCHVHKKLSDIRSMCEGCLLSFATQKDSDCDKYKSLVGILHKDIDCFVEDNQKLLMNLGTGDDFRDQSDDQKSGINLCSCCGETLKSRSSSKYKRSVSTIAPAPSPRAPLLTRRNEEGRSILLPHVKYTELKHMSDAEQELTEYEDATIGENQGRNAVKAASVPSLTDSEDINEDNCRTPSFARGNRFFGIPLCDSTQASPRWGYKGARKIPIDGEAESHDASGFNEIDDDVLNRLKRQVHLDRKSLIALYMELDEERSASAVAANNAMAMITRLQAEKAAVQMEALQYQRMMEEQAEYDQEALQVMKDMLLKREEDVKALEAEIEMYREKYGHIKKVGSDICEVDADDDYQDMKSQSLTFTEKSDCGSSCGADRNENDLPNSMEYGEGSPDESPLDFEGERSYLLSLLKDLEKKIDTPSDEVSSSSEYDEIKNKDKTKEKEKHGSLTREVSLIRERLRTIEADSGFLKHAAMTLQRGGEGTKLLTEIAQHLRQLRDTVKSPSEDVDA